MTKGLTVITHNTGQSEVIQGYGSRKWQAITLAVFTVDSADKPRQEWITRRDQVIQKIYRTEPRMVRRYLKSQPDVTLTPNQ